MKQSLFAVEIVVLAADVKNVECYLNTVVVVAVVVGVVVADVAAVAA